MDGPSETRGTLKIDRTFAYQWPLLRPLRRLWITRGFIITDLDDRDDSAVANGVVNEVIAALNPDRVGASR